MGQKLMFEENQNPAASDFTATDSDGRLIHLSDYRGKKSVVLVFNRGFFNVYVSTNNLAFYYVKKASFILSALKRQYT